jgi:flagellar basal-body rod protein FlgC
MIGSLQISLSGLRAAETRVTVAANNVANSGSAGHTVKGAAEAGDAAISPYQAMATATTSNSDGGVTVQAIPTDADPIHVFSPGNRLADSEGLVAFPNVSLTEQLMEVKLATQSYEANVSVINAQSEMLGTLLDSFS